MNCSVINIFGGISGSAKTRALKNLLLFAFHFSLLLVCFCANAPAQSDEEFELTAPPPLKIYSKAEKSALDGAQDISERTKLALMLMDIRLKQAEDLSAKESYDEMQNELGGFHALVDESLAFLNRRDDGRNGKVLNNFKRLELNLRQFIPRVERIRRDLPARFEPYVRGLIKNLRVARSRAVEPLFSDSVVPSSF